MFKINKKLIYVKTSSLVFHEILLFTASCRLNRYFTDFCCIFFLSKTRISTSS